LKAKRCLYCYRKDGELINEYHAKCSLKLFGNKKPVKLQFSNQDIRELAAENINNRITIPGVQPKLSLNLTEDKKENRLTIVGLWGNYILKPPFDLYPEMPEIEDLTMHLAEIAGIKTSVHGLIRMDGGKLGYLTKRFDRKRTGKVIEKIYAEDFCQLTETITSDKYSGSVEKIARTIKRFSDYSGLDITRLFEITVFSFLTGNADMHLKNFSLYRNSENEITLSPAYDLIASRLLIPDDKDESALTINGKKSNLTLNDFKALSKSTGISDKVFDNIFNSYKLKIREMLTFIDQSFTGKEVKERYKELIIERSQRLKLKL